MSITADYLKSKLERELKTTFVEVFDDSDGCGLKFRVIIVSDEFDGKPLLERHRLVNGILKEELPNIHAFSQKTLTVDQWQKIKETN